MEDQRPEMALRSLPCPDSAPRGPAPPRPSSCVIEGREEGYRKQRYSSVIAHKATRGREKLCLRFPSSSIWVYLMLAPSVGAVVSSQWYWSPLQYHSSLEWYWVSSATGDHFPWLTSHNLVQWSSGLLKDSYSSCLGIALPSGATKISQFLFCTL